MRTVTAPDLSPGYPSKGAKIGPAWTEAWAKLSEVPSEWLDGQALWEGIAPSHGLHPDTLRGLLFRMAAGQSPILEREIHKVMTEKGIRSRTHFRILVKES